MAMKLHTIPLLACLAAWLGAAQAQTYSLSSPDGKLKVDIQAGDALSFSLSDSGIPLLRDSKIGLNLEGRGEDYRVNRQLTGTKTETCDVPFYRNPHFSTRYNLLSLYLKSGLEVEFRVYDDGMAYRFATPKMKGKTYIVEGEQAAYRFAGSTRAWLPYSTNPRKPQAMAFQATYSDTTLTAQPADNLAFLPATVAVGGDKVTVMESDLESYPGMFVKPDGDGLQGWWAARPKAFDYYPWRVQKYVTETEDYIARCTGSRTFPWRILAVSRDDREMPVNNLVCALASPNRIGDTSWIQPGLVCWDWWNDWGISGVDFEAGINMPTYKYYIDFAHKYGLPYIIMDEGWYAPRSGDMLTTIPDIQLPELVDYARERGVRIILWTVFNVLDKDLENICRHYAEMGIAGFKVDFLDRDDQEGVEMVYRIAEACARHHLLLDLHGIYKPTGIWRTFPNIVNFESVFGMEEAKWTAHEGQDMPEYDVTFPFIRLQSGYTDFTPGGMRNATRKDFQPVYSNPMTMGTRCHQLAMYIVHDSPLTMLADNPTAYDREPDFTRFVASLPTTFDETSVLMGRVGEYIVTARRKGNVWYVGGQTDWESRDLELPSFLPAGNYTATLYADGLNADKVATDYTVRHLDTFDPKSPFAVHLASGGGFLLKLEKL